MKFWKPALYTTLLFSAIVSTVLYTSCEKNPCNNVTCFNGGSCGNGICVCPTGYENAQCQDRAVARYVGAYGGYIRCNTPQQTIDSIFIYADSTSKATLNYVWVVWKSLSPKVLRGYVYNNEATYSIQVADEVRPNFTKIYTFTLQGFDGANNKLVAHTYERSALNPGDTVMSECSFIGMKVE